MIASLIAEIGLFFNSSKPEEISNRIFKALKYRWGFPKMEFRALVEVADKFKIRPNELYLAETDFLQRLGWSIELSEKNRYRWLKS